MSRPGTIDGPRFAAEREVVTGALAISDLPRLAEMGCEAATLRYAVRGGEDADARATLAIEAMASCDSPASAASACWRFRWR